MSLFKPSLVLLATSLLLTACGRPGTSSSSGVDAAAEKITVQKGVVENRVVATGKVAARSDSKTAFARSGRVSTVLVKEGDTVVAGQPMAKIDATELQSSADQQWANFLNAQAAYSQTIKGPTPAELAAAQAAVASSESAYADLSRAPGANTLASLSLALANAQTTLRQRQAAALDNSGDISAVLSTLRSAEASLRQKQAAYDRRASHDNGVGGSPEALELERATNDFIAAKANYDKTVKNIQLDLERAKNDVGRAQADYNVKFDKPTDAQLANATSQIEQAKKNLAALTPTTETIQQREAQMNQARFGWKVANDALANATLAAPFNGLVTKVSLSVGDWANTGATAIQLADFTVPVFEMDVDEVDLGSVKAGQTARVRLQTYPEVPIAATVESVAIIGTTSGSVVTYKVKLALGKALNGETPTILINMSGTGEVVTAQSSSALVVPTRALIIDTTTRAFSLQRLSTDKTKTESVPVKLGFRDVDKVEILEGISAGDTIVVPAVKIAPSTGGPGG